ncbi:MAG: hypothetical protein H7X99_10725 [Saprospiraceae bacterium]|nr:hypothetical protein [Saprospiraceae bacterium]
MNKLVIVLFLSLIIFNTVSGQTANLALGNWKSHLAYKEGISVTQSKDNVMYASQRGMILINKSDLSVSYLAKEDGLSDVNISRLYYDKHHEQLIIIYSDNNIDILNGTEITNIPFIKSNLNIIGSKTINDVFLSQSNEAVIATDFGVLGFNTDKLEFSFTTFTDLRVNEVSILDGTLYAGTEEGLFKVSLTGTNLSDFSNWQQLTSTEGLPQSYEVKALAVQYNNLYVLINNNIYKMSTPGQFSIIFTPTISTDKINYISEEGTSLMVGIEDNQNRSRTVFIDESGTISDGGADCINRVLFAIEDEKGRIWYADQWDPIRYTENKTSGCVKLVFPGPFANTAGEVSFKKNVAYFSSLGITDDYQYAFTNRGFYEYTDGKWNNYNQDNVALIRDKDFQNVQAIAPHPNTPEIYIGSYWNGLLSYNTETKEAKHWNKDNSMLQGVTGDEARTRISSLYFDKDNNLWISNFGAPKPLVVKTKDDTWYNFSVPGSKDLGDIAIDHQGNKWIAVVGVGNGLLVFNEGAKIADPTDDMIRYITKNNSEISGNKVNSLVVDLDGSVWVGTDQGSVVFDCGDPFDENCRGNTRKVVVDNIPALLLKDEDILSIEVDGGNRKWFGTRNGIFVQSPDGITQEARFTVKNSPLLDNKVTDLSYNPISGEIFITSAGGIQSYKTFTTSGGSNHSANVYAYPNPVYPEYNGYIAIKGLIRDANIKITDINGKLIYETKALGGQAIWDGKDYNGVRASTGVYLVFSANESTSGSPEAFVTKILFIN